MNDELKNKMVEAGVNSINEMLKDSDVGDITAEDIRKEAEFHADRILTESTEWEQPVSEDELIEAVNMYFGESWELKHSGLC